jgi:catechol 2,3-dioxygenase-like lactoylglutathione lyase family enzyme
MSLDHLGISTKDYDVSRAFYEKALAPLGITPMMVFDNEGGRTTGFGDTNPFLWIGDGGIVTGRLHIALSAKTWAEVDAFYAAAMAAGGRDNGAPGLRPHYHPTYYGAYVLDPDGHNIEAVCHGPA